MKNNQLSNFFKVICFYALMSVASFASATSLQTQKWFTYTEQGLFGSKNEIKLEILESEPVKWNGKIVVLNHGSTGRGHGANGYDEKRIKNTVKFTKIVTSLTEQGFKTFVLMRKGRGNSEGTFTEEDDKACSWGDQMRGVQEAEPQIDQFVDWVRKEYKVDKVIMMGHSRGGFLSSYYSSKHSDKVEHAVNISGGWTTVCENKNSMTYQMLNKSSSAFKNQTWVYSNKDTYFTDQQIEGYKQVADKSGIQFIYLDNTSQADGHSFAPANPKLWQQQIESLN